jgi:hypothetical protein
MISLQQSALEQAAAECRAGHYVEAWAIAGSDARARTYVRYHAGDLEGALSEAHGAGADPWLSSQATEIALALHRGAAAEVSLAAWGAAGDALAAPAIEAARRELGELRATQRAAQSGVRRARWINAGALLLALVFLLRFARTRS